MLYLLHCALLLDLALPELLEQHQLGLLESQLLLQLFDNALSLLRRTLLQTQINGVRGHNQTGGNAKQAVTCPELVPHHQFISVGLGEAVAVHDRTGWLVV